MGIGFNFFSFFIFLLFLLGDGSMNFLFTHKWILIFSNKKKVKMKIWQFTVSHGLGILSGVLTYHLWSQLEQNSQQNALPVIVRKRSSNGCPPDILHGEFQDAKAADAYIERKRLVYAGLPTHVATIIEFL